jgi:hypothetical protein
MFEEDTLRLFGHVLTSSFFSFGGQFYEQTNGAATGSQIFPSGDWQLLHGGAWGGGTLLGQI